MQSSENYKALQKIMIPFIGGKYAIKLHTNELVISLKRTMQR